MANKKDEICFLCGKSKSEVSHMIKGKFGYICDECVQAAHDVLNDKEEEDISYNMELERPSQIKSYLHIQWIRKKGSSGTTRQGR